MIRLLQLTKELTKRNSITEQLIKEIAAAAELVTQNQKRDNSIFIHYLSWLWLTCLPCHCLCSSLLHRSTACWSRSHALPRTWGRTAPRHTPPDTEPWCYTSGLRSSMYGSSGKGWPLETNHLTCIQFVSWASRRHVSAWNRTDQERLLIEF